MRYQFIDTLTGEIIRETSTYPAFAGLRRKPRQTTYKARGRRKRTPTQVKQDAALALGLVTVLAGTLVSIM